MHPRPLLHRRLWLVVAVAALASAVAVATSSAPASAEVAPTSCTKTLGGTLRGEDGRYLSAFVGAVFYDSKRQPIAAAACSNPKPGYDGANSVNENGTCCYLLGPEGASSGEQAWSIPAPGNAAYAWIEAYPKANSTPDGPHKTTYERYGGAMRRMVAVSPSIALRLPLGCGLGAGGDNGTISGKVVRRGVPVRVTRVSAFSRAVDGPSLIMGFGVQGQGGTADGRFSYKQLSPGQRYALNLTTSVGSFWFEHDYGRGILVNPCRTTSVTIDVGYIPPRLTVHPGATTVGVRRGTDMLLTDSRSGGEATIQYAFGLPDDRILVGDWNGDGVDTAGVQRGRVFILSNSREGAGPFTQVTYGLATDTPVVGDWDGNGTDTIGVRRGNAYYLRNANTSGPAHVSFGYGTASDTPVVGDWDGNGTDTPGIRRGSTFHLRNANTSGPAQLSFSYGLASDVPVVGDWDGNRTDTPGIRRGSTFHLRNANSGGAAHVSITYGTDTDLPVVGDWDGA